jgi:formylglycine-generating enzyme required for sulfatase activity
MDRAEMAPKIFLAHAREDKAQVKKLYADLKARGFDPWLDEVDLLPGQIWKDEIPKAIRQAGVFLACLSSRSVGKVGYVQNEFRLALSAFGERPPETIFLIPVRLDDCAVPDLQIPDRGLSLRDIQWVDLWQEDGLDRLVRAIEKALEIPNKAPTLRAPAEAVALRLGVAPDQAPVHIASDDADVAEFLSQPIDKDTLSYYTKWKYPGRPLNPTLQELLLRDLSNNKKIKTLEDLNCALDVAADAVDLYRKEDPDVFKTATDFLTKSLGFADQDFRAKHGFFPQTRQAFANYEHLVRSEKARETAPEQKVIEKPPGTAVESAAERETERRGARLWQNPTIIAAIVVAIATVAAAPWLLEQVSDGNGSRDQEPQETPGEEDLVATAPPQSVPMTTITDDPFRECDACPLMVAVHAGSFMMGSTEADRQSAVRQGATGERLENEKPQHRVRITEPFAVGKYEVTFDEWDACVADGGCNGYNPDDAPCGGGRKPVIHVSREDAQAYVAWLGNETGQPYRLLSEAEWEYAARAGTTTSYSWGDGITAENANYGGIQGCTTQVGEYPRNPWGLHDMHGNVWEWVEDCWNDSYEGAPSDGSAWASGDCSRGVFRGGSFSSRSWWWLRSAYRFPNLAVNRLNDVGFRVARTLR